MSIYFQAGAVHPPAAAAATFAPIHLYTRTLPVPLLGRISPHTVPVGGRPFNFGPAPGAQIPDIVGTRFRRARPTIEVPQSRDRFLPGRSFIGRPFFIGPVANAPIPDLLSTIFHRGRPVIPVPRTRSTWSPSMAEATPPGALPVPRNYRTRFSHQRPTSEPRSRRHGMPGALSGISSPDDRVPWLARNRFIPNKAIIPEPRTARFGRPELARQDDVGPALLDTRLFLNKAIVPEPRTIRIYPPELIVSTAINDTSVASLRVRLFINKAIVAEPRTFRFGRPELARQDDAGASILDTRLFINKAVIPEPRTFRFGRPELARQDDIGPWLLDTRLFINKAIIPEPRTSRIGRGELFPRGPEAVATGALSSRLVGPLQGKWLGRTRKIGIDPAVLNAPLPTQDAAIWSLYTRTYYQEPKKREMGRGSARPAVTHITPPILGLVLPNLNDCVIQLAGTRADSLRLKVGGVEVPSLAAIGTIQGVIVLAVAGANGKGTGQLRTRANGKKLQWRAPGSGRYGSTVDISTDGQYLIEDGEDFRKWVRVDVLRTYVLPTDQTAAVYMQDIYDNGIASDDVTAAEASAGAVETFTVDVTNDNPDTVFAVKVWIETPKNLEISDDGATWVVPTFEGHADAVDLGSIAGGGAAKTLHMRRTIGAAAPSSPEESNILRVAFDGV